MADIYVPGTVPPEYDEVFVTEELQRISQAIAGLEPQIIMFVPQHNAPDKLVEGMVVYADGTDWNPGSGAGLYERTSSVWVKL